MEEDRGIIFDIKQFAIHDGPGIRTTVFFKGCPLNCWWCHNPESRNPEPEKMLSNISVLIRSGKDCQKDIVGKEVTVSEVIAELIKDVIFFDESGGGVTFSGGEALMQPEFLSSLLQECRIKRIHTCLDTSGYASKDILVRIINDVDLFLYDLKFMNDELHRKYTNVGNTIILQNLEYIASMQKNIIIRIPIIPGITDTEENILGLSEYISRLENIQRVDLLPYNKMGENKYKRLEKKYQLNNLEPPSEERMNQIKEKFEIFNLNVKIGG